MAYILQNKIVKIHGEMELRLELCANKNQYRYRIIAKESNFITLNLDKNRSQAPDKLTQIIRNLCQNFPNRLNFVSKNKTKRR